MQMHQSRGKNVVILREITSYVSIIQQFQILIGNFQNLLHKALRKSWRLDISNVGNSKVVKFGK